MVAGVLVVHGGGLIATASDYIVFIMVLAGATLAGLLSTKRSARLARPASVPVPVRADALRAPVAAIPATTVAEARSHGTLQGFSVRRLRVYKHAA